MSVYPPHDYGLIESMRDWELGYNQTPKPLAGHWQQITDMQDACRIYVPHRGDRMLVGTFSTPEFAAYALMAVNERRARAEYRAQFQQPEWPRPPLSFD